MAEFEKIGNVYDFGQDEDLSIVVKVNGQAYKSHSTRVRGLK